MTTSTGPIVFSGRFPDDLQLFRTAFVRCSDVIYRTFTISSGLRVAVIYIDGIVDDTRLENDVLRPLMNGSADEMAGTRPAARLMGKLTADKLRSEPRLEEAVLAVCKGEAALLVEGGDAVLLTGMTKWETRAVEEPATEPVIRGPRDGFTESLTTNLSLIRKRLATPDLKTESMRLGRRSRTSIQLLYLEHTVQQSVLEEVRRRIGRIDLDGVLDSGYVEELIADQPFSLFPQLLSTERPDRVAGSILEGRVAILVDNSPFALVAPCRFADTLQASEDYYQHFLVATATRLLRFWLSFSALVFPSIYVAVTSFHQEMIPTSLLLGIASSREAVPFPAIVEAILMEAAFEGLREAGIRLPRPVGQAVSIVGALVIGQAAVQAGIVSSILVIVVSFTGIASFVFPTYSQSLAIRLLRFPMIILAGTLGLYGLFLGLLALLIHLVKLRSFGVPYLSPVVPLQLQGLKDVLGRSPWWSLRSRPRPRKQS